ncbi:unnamed protein product [Didymodactylos carnosus]|uniref:Helix-turn-helix domain-containing protein n=1 Tax=Didymodactylos carnosus TaxID=1234261 RepID=A0A8S2EHI9_9BILA|nr:unnamed protein product [Didymodactylos carnosus]CAF4016520.1 unnamed protein product [Didymodactylos carnosus]
MLRTQAYEEITDDHCPLADNLRAVQTLLDYLVTKNGLTKKQCHYLLPKLGNLELRHYHGLPKPHKPGTPLRPIIASINAPATSVSKKYVADGRLKLTTRFITADVTDLYTMIPRQGALDALARFCLEHSKQGKIGTLAIDYIMKMARLILDTNNFVYNNKYYRQIRGGAVASALTQVLANIFMLEWEHDLIQYQIARHEIYGRTTLYHKPAAEPYILPRKSDHPRHSHRNIPYGALVRALRICSNRHDFNTELVRIDMTLLLNGYPPNFITKQFNRLFDSNHDMSLLIRMDEHIYHRIHHTLLHQPTRREKQLQEMMQNPVESPSILQPKV